jgi:hypothetical protein
MLCYDTENNYISVMVQTETAFSYKLRASGCNPPWAADDEYILLINFK